MEVLLLGFDPSLSRRDPREVCLAFEALFLEKLLQAMDQTVQRAGLFPDTTAGKIYRSLWYQALAYEIARGGGLGLAQRLLARLSSAKVSPGAADIKNGRE